VSQITALKAQKNQKRANLFIDGQFICGLSLDLVVSNGLVVGQQLSKTSLQSLLNDALLEKFYSRALSFLSYRPRSRFELERYLGKKMASQNPCVQPIIKKIIAKLERKNLLNESEFARWWINQRLKFRPKGKLVLKSELIKKGVDRQIIKQALDKIDEEQILKDFYQKKLKKKKLLLADKQKLINYLKRRGFLWENIRSLIDDLDQKE